MLDLLREEVPLVGNLLNDRDLASRPTLPETLPVTWPCLHVGVIKVLTLKAENLKNLRTLRSLLSDLCFKERDQSISVTVIPLVILKSVTLSNRSPNGPLCMMSLYYSKGHLGTQQSRQ